MVDAGTAAFLGALRAAGGKPITEQTPTEFREQVRGGSLALAPPAEPMHDVRDLRIPGPGGEVPLRIYTPRALATGETLPLVVHYHGAGWVGGDLDTHDAIARYYATHADAIVIAVDYRLAPEHRFPAAVDDAYAAAEWAAAHGRAFGGDPARLAVTGDSAGGTLATVVCALARDRGGPAIRFQALLYPPADLRSAASYASRAAFGGGDYFLGAADIDWFRRQYLPSPETDAQDPRVSPIVAADLSRLPPALIVTAGFDPLLDEGKAYAERLSEAGVAVEYRCFDETVHAFVSFAGMIPAGIEALALVSSRLRRALHQ
jgi:acetyl esterase